MPVKNLWLLMLYASNLFSDLLRDAPAKKQHYEENPEEMFDLIAEILMGAVERRLRRNLTVELARRHDVLTRVRGRIDHMYTARHRLLQQGMIACSFDEFTADTPKNRLVRHALDRLSQMPHLKAEWRQRCRADSEALDKAGVRKNPAGSYDNVDESTIVRTVRNPDDRMMLAAARLALYMRIPAEAAGLAYFDALDRTDQSWVRSLFEKAVAGFYHARFPEWNVHHGDRLEWQKGECSKGIDSLLPGMQTDITIEKTDERTGKRSRIIIDTKFTDITTASNYKARLLKSGYIYQMYSYLRSQERGADDDMSRTSSGMLLHPSVDGDMDEWLEIQGHVFRFATVDLSADCKSIRDRLVHLMKSKPF